MVPEMVNTIASLNVSLPEAALRAQKYVGNKQVAQLAEANLSGDGVMVREWSTLAAKCIRPSNTKE